MPLHDLQHILDLCQADHLPDWVVIPGGQPGTDLLVGLVDAGSSGAPALTALPHEYRAVYVPDARVGIGWGMDTEPGYARYERKPDWASNDWNSVHMQYAHVLLDGVMVWRVLYLYVDRGAGRDGYLPYLATQFEDTGTHHHARQGWDLLRWELEFARLIGQLQHNASDFDIDQALKGFGVMIRDVSPIDHARRDR
jgi:hypothetical protein